MPEAEQQELDNALQDQTCDDGEMETMPSPTSSNVVEAPSHQPDANDLSAALVQVLMGLNQSSSSRDTPPAPMSPEILKALAQQLKLLQVCEKSKGDAGMSTDKTTDVADTGKDVGKNTDVADTGKDVGKNTDNVDTGKEVGKNTHMDVDTGRAQEQQPNTLDGLELVSVTIDKDKLDQLQERLEEKKKEGKQLSRTPCPLPLYKPPEHTFDLTEFGNWLPRFTRVKKDESIKSTKGNLERLFKLLVFPEGADPKAVLCQCFTNKIIDQLREHPFMDNHYTWPKSMMYALEHYLNYLAKDCDRFRPKKRQVQEELMQLSEDVVRGYKGDDATQRAIQIKAKKKKDTYQLSKQWPKTEDIKEAVKQAMVDLQYLVHNYDGTFRMLAKLNRLIIGIIHFNDFAGRSLEWQKLKAAHVHEQFDDGKHVLVCEESKTAETYGDVGKHLCPGTKAAMQCYDSAFTTEFERQSPLFFQACSGNKISLSYYLKKFGLEFFPGLPTINSNLVRKQFHSVVDAHAARNKCFQMMEGYDKHGKQTMIRTYICKSAEQDAEYGEYIFKEVYGDPVEWPTEEEYSQRKRDILNILKDVEEEPDEEGEVATQAIADGAEEQEDATSEEEDECWPQVEEEECQDEAGAKQEDEDATDETLLEELDKLLEEEAEDEDADAEQDSSEVGEEADAEKDGNEVAMVMDAGDEVMDAEEDADAEQDSSKVGEEADAEKDGNEVAMVIDDGDEVAPDEDKTSDEGDGEKKPRQLSYDDVLAAFKAAGVQPPHDPDGLLHLSNYVRNVLLLEETSSEPTGGDSLELIAAKAEHKAAVDAARMSYVRNDPSFREDAEEAVRGVMLKVVKWPKLKPMSKPTPKRTHRHRLHLMRRPSSAQSVQAYIHCYLCIVVVCQRLFFLFFSRAHLNQSQKKRTKLKLRDTTKGL